jgi:O-antigen biosynthesis protein WbqP
MIAKIISVLLLTVLLPLLFVVLIITSIDLRANPIFVQNRVIDGTRTFRFYKIRSMKKSAPQLPTGLLANPNLYITKWGKFLRTSSIDEILNLISIINGDMKFIGPRPIMADELELIELRKKNGINSKGGITGLAQITGRDFISDTRKIAAERYYISKHCFSLDLFILTKTIHMVLKRSGISH